MQNSVISTRKTCLYGTQPSSVVLCIQKCDIRTKIPCLYGSQPSPVILCIQNGMPSIRNTSLYGFQPLSVGFGWKTATFGPEKQVSVCPRPHLSFSACKTAWLASKILVSMGRSPRPSFLEAKQRLLDQNNKSLWVQDLTCRFVHGK